MKLLFYSRGQLKQRPTTSQCAENKRLSECFTLNRTALSHPYNQGSWIITDRGNGKIVTARKAVLSTVETLPDLIVHCLHQLKAAGAACTRPTEDQAS